METEQTAEPSNLVLRRFFETSESARKAAAHLKSAAQVGVRFTDVPGDSTLPWSRESHGFSTGRRRTPISS